MAHSEIDAGGVVRVVLVDANALVYVETAGQRAVEEPGVGKADGPLLRLDTGADPDRDLPAAAQEVALREVDRADQRVHRGVAAADAEQAGRSLDDHDVHDDARLVGAGLRVDVDGLEVAEVDEPLAGPFPGLERVEINLVQLHLTAQDLVLAPDVAADVDALDVHFGPFGDLEGQVDLVERRQLVALGVHVGRGAADRAVEVQDPRDAVSNPTHREHVAGLEPDLPVDLALRQQGDPGHLHVADAELGPIHDDDRDRHARPLAIDGDVVRLDAGLDVAVVVVEADQPVDVQLEALALDLAAHDEVLPLLRLHRFLELVVPQPLVAAELDHLDRHLAPFDDVEDQLHVRIGEFLDGGSDLDLEVALVLVEVAELFDGTLHVDRVVHAAELHVDLVLQGVPVFGLVAHEVDVANEGALRDGEDDLDAALEVLDPQLDVVEEAEAEDGADILGEKRGVEGRADGALDSAEDHGVLHTPIAFDVD